MSAPAERAPATGLYGPDGRLLNIRITVDAHLLEPLLESLADLPYPINPQLRHDYGSHSGYPCSMVEFPAYEGWVPDIERSLALEDLTLDGAAGRLEVVVFILDHAIVDAA
jgi:hypothetical protein